MLTHPLFEQLKTLRCQGMLEAFQEQLKSPDINCRRLSIPAIKWRRHPVI